MAHPAAQQLHHLLQERQLCRPGLLTLPISESVVVTACLHCVLSEEFGLGFRIKTHNPKGSRKVGKLAVFTQFCVWQVFKGKV